MGYAIAEAALAAGHTVTLISGPACLAPPKGAHFVAITTSDEMHHKVQRAVRDCDVLVMCAAVSDFKPATSSPRKLKKRTAPFALKLVPTRDILVSLSKERRNYFVVGFAAETHDLEKNARLKLRKKNCDMIVANDVSKAESGMESDQNAVSIYCQDGKSRKISRASKTIIARQLVKIISKMSEKCLTKKS